MYDLPCSRAKNVWIDMVATQVGASYTLSQYDGTLLDRNPIDPLFARDGNEPNQVIWLYACFKAICFIYD